MDLTEFAHANVLPSCTVCALAKPIREQLEVAEQRRLDGDKSFGRPVMLRWLRHEHNLALTESTLRRHFTHMEDH